MLIVEPRVVAADRGFGWWGDGIRIFLKSPWMWMAIIAVYAVVAVLVALVPFVGTVGQSLLTPVFVGGMMFGCRALDRGEPLRVAHLFEGFQGARFVPLLIVGAVNVALAIALALLSGAGVLGTFGLSQLSTITDPMEALNAPLGAVTLTAVLVMVLVLVVAAVVAMLNWFAPALVTLRGISALEAMKLSFVACLRNWLPFLLYGLVVIVAAIIASIAMGVFALLFGAGAIMSGSLERGLEALVGFFVLLALVTLLLIVIVGPIAVGSIYAGFKDTLDDADATVTSPAYR
jgi:uncharacterized membrane protein